MSYNIKPRYNKDGELISYCIRVDRGRDAEGVRMKPYTTTWRVPEGYTSAKKIQMELNSVAGQFEADCKAGKILTKEERKAKARADAERAEQERLEKERRVTFKAYASDVFMARKATTFSRNAYTNYEDALNRLNKYLGDYPLEEIKSADINRCLVALQTREYCRQSKGREKGKTKVEDSGKLISFSTVIKCYTVLSGVFKMAGDSSLVTARLAPGTSAEISLNESAQNQTVVQSASGKAKKRPETDRLRTSSRRHIPNTGTRKVRWREDQDNCCPESRHSNIHHNDARCHPGRPLPTHDPHLK